MRLADLRRSALVRIAAAYALLIGCSLSALLLLLLIFVNHDTREQTREAIEQDVRELTKIYAQLGRDELIENLRILSTSIEADRSLYLLEDASGAPIVGTDQKLEPVEGWTEMTLPRRSKKPDHFLIFVSRLDGLTLFVGRRTHTEAEVRHSVLRSFSFALCLVVPVLLGVGVYLGRRAFRRVEEIADVMRSFVSGQLGKRAPVSRKGDEIDHLAINVNQTLQQVEKLLTNLRQVTSDIAHDLKTPLGRLRQRLELEARRYEPNSGVLNDAIDDIDGILSTFDSLMQIAEIDSGVARQNFKEVDLSDLARTVHDIYGTVAEDHGHALRLDAVGKVIVSGDRNLLTQLLVNLIENAIRHTPKGSTITVSVAAKEGRALLVVADNGPGIPPSQRQRVLERFYRLEASRTTPGSGLGLALVKAISELHDGEIEFADNNPGVVVRIDLPTASNHLSSIVKLG